MQTHCSTGIELWEPRPHRAPAFYLTPPCPGGKSFLSREQVAHGARSHVPCLRERQPKRLNQLYMVLLLQAQRTSPVPASTHWSCPVPIQGTLLQAACSACSILVPRQPWGALLWVVARTTPSFSQAGLPQAGSIRGSLHKGGII